ncbi:hypothetical protein [Inconstantimicrobium mannanitabidum]|uniref:Uncharacterized protein n=1 Tax=Inconstantimicrobium mannanitabidum TaxID=1604901 RepID=A0ACB5R9M6_9CLOT|nr:hypothetical protein [Clostridium sp. TW13]GKX65832.1 hypothetical protein rsdtw13_10900 [Clostridium sp. TW13]
MTDDEYEQMAIISIRNYLNKDFTDDEIKTQFGLAMKLLVEKMKINPNRDKSVIQLNQGSRSVSFDNSYSVMDNDVKILLPRPYLRMC